MPTSTNTDNALTVFGLSQNASPAEIRQATDNDKTFAPHRTARKPDARQNPKSNRRALPNSKPLRISPENDNENRVDLSEEIRGESRKTRSAASKTKKKTSALWVMIVFFLTLPSLGIIISIWEAIFDGGGGNSGAPLDKVKKNWKN